MALANTLQEGLLRSIALYEELIAALPESTLADKLPGLRSNTVGDQLWCVVGARESYARAIAGGEWKGFACSLTSEGARQRDAVEAALVSSAARVLEAVRGLDGGDDARNRLLVDLVEHEAAHHGQLIRYLYALHLPVPAGWRARYALEAGDRPRPAPPRGDVALREIDETTVRAICKLAVRPDQTRFVAPNAVSISQAHFSDRAWFRAVYVGEEPAGFVMLSDDPAKPEYYLWRFMIDARYQRLGIGRRALSQVIDHVKARPGAKEFLTSVVPGDGTPQPFYESLGFRATGEIEGGEVVLRLSLGR